MSTERQMQERKIKFALSQYALNTPPVPPASELQADASAPFQGDRGIRTVTGIPEAQFARFDSVVRDFQREHMTMVRVTRTSRDKGRTWDATVKWWPVGEKEPIE